MKKSLPLLLLFVVLAGAALWLWRNNTGSTLDKDLADFVVPDTASVSRIFIAETTGRSVDLRRTVLPNGAEAWTVNGLPANNASVGTLLKTFHRVEVRTPVAKSSTAVVLKALAVGGKKVEIYTGGAKPEKIWYVGAGTPDHNGTYMLLEKPDVGRSASPFVVGIYGFTGTLDTRFHADIDLWRSLHLFSYPDLAGVQRVEVDHPGGDAAENFSVVLENGRDLHLLGDVDGEVPMDTARVRELMLGLRQGNFEYLERILPKAKRDSVLASTPWHILQITSAQGTRRIPFWHKAPDPNEVDMEFRRMTDNPYRMFSVVDDTTLVVVQRLRYDPLVPRLSELRRR